ncbi:hypothetical protein PMAYCL1PPCAC_11135, partial [Pristionchus mayeri]
FSNQEMKLAVLIFALIGSCYGGVLDREVRGADGATTITGTITCSKPFISRFNLWEEPVGGNNGRRYNDDNWFWFHSEDIESRGSRRSFSIDLMVYKDMTVADRTIAIEHTCGTDYACVCKHLGSKNDKFAIGEIELEKRELNNCAACARTVALWGEHTIPKIPK